MWCVVDVDVGRVRSTVPFFDGRVGEVLGNSNFAVRPVSRALVDV